MAGLPQDGTISNLRAEDISTSSSSDATSMFQVRIQPSGRRRIDLTPTNFTGRPNHFCLDHIIDGGASLCFPSTGPRWASNYLLDFLGNRAASPPYFALLVFLTYYVVLFATVIKAFVPMITHSFLVWILIRWRTYRPSCRLMSKCRIPAAKPRTRPSQKWK